MKTIRKDGYAPALRIAYLHFFFYYSLRTEIYTHVHLVSGSYQRSRRPPVP